MASSSEEEAFYPSENEKRTSVDESDESDEQEFIPQQSTLNRTSQRIQDLHTEETTEHADNPLPTSISTKLLDGPTTIDIKYIESRETLPRMELASKEGIQLAEANPDACRICLSDEGSAENCIVYCDSCDITFHQECYNVEIIPEGDWFCRYCEMKKKQETLSTNSGNNSSLYPDVNGEDVKGYSVLLENQYFATVCNFLYQFGLPLNLPPISIQDLSNSLLDDRVNDFLIELHVVLMRKLEVRGVSLDTWEQTLRKTLAKRNVVTLIDNKRIPIQKFYEVDECNPLEVSPYEELKLSSKVVILKLLCEWQFDFNSKLIAYVRDLPEDELRQGPLGADGQDRIYWLIEDDRRFCVVRHSRYDGKNWKAICCTMEKLDDLIQHFSFASKTEELQLWHTLSKTLKPYLERKFTAAQKLEAKLSKATRRLGRLGTSGLDLSAIIFDNDENSLGRRSRRSRKQIDYSFQDYDESIKESLRKTRVERDSLPRKPARGYNPSKYLSRTDRFAMRQNVPLPTTEENAAEDDDEAVSKRRRIISDSSDADSDDIPPPPPPPLEENVSTAGNSFTLKDMLNPPSLPPTTTTSAGEASRTHHTSENSSQGLSIAS